MAAGALRVKLGESLASVQEHARPLDRYTTTSLEALQTYARGYELAAAGQYIAAIPFFRRATELDPAFAMAHQTLSIMYSNSGARGRAVESQRRAFALIADIERDTAAAQRGTMWFTGRPEEYVSFGTQAANADALGQRRRAHELYRRAADMARQRNLAEAATEFDEADTMGAAWSGNCGEGASESPPLALAVCGDGAAATRLAGEMSQELSAGTIWRQVQLPTIPAAIELRRDQPARAVEILASALAYERAYPEVPYLRGLSYLRLKKNAEAAAEFHKVVDHRPAGWGIIYGVSHLGLARAAARSGDMATALRAYQTLLALWNDADESALLNDARRELSALQSATASAPWVPDS